MINTTKSDNIWTASIEQILAVKLLANWAAVCKLLDLDMPRISEQVINN